MLSGLRRRTWRSDATEPGLQYSAGLGAGMSPCGTYVLYCRGGAGAVAPTPSSPLCYAASRRVCLTRVYCLRVGRGVSLCPDVYYHYESHNRIMYIFLDVWIYLTQLFRAIYKRSQCKEMLCTAKALKTRCAAIKYKCAGGSGSDNKLCGILVSGSAEQWLWHIRGYCGNIYTIYIWIGSYFAYHNVYTYLCFIYIRYRLGVKLAPLVSGQHKSNHHRRTYDPTYMRSAALANQGQRVHGSSRRGKGSKRNQPVPRLVNSYVNYANGTLNDQQLSSKMCYRRYQYFIKGVGFRVVVYVRLRLVQEACVIFVMIHILCKALTTSHNVHLVMRATCKMIQHMIVKFGGGVSLIKLVHDYWQKHTKNFVLE